MNKKPSLKGNIEEMDSKLRNETDQNEQLFKQSIPIKWGSFVYNNTFNLGDEIQSIAANRFIPKIDYFIDRDYIADFHPPAGENVRIVANGWYSHRAENLFFQDRVCPLLISVHFSSLQGFGPLKLSATDLMRHSDFLEHLKTFQPIGARDLQTMQILQKAGIDSYFSGCLTLTLEGNPSIIQKDLIVCVDVPGALVEFVANASNSQILCVSAVDITEGVVKERFAKAERLLEIYQSARYVVTSRLHCALPCLAYGIPVLLVDLAQDQERFSGLHNLVRHAKLDEILRKNVDFDFRNPSPNTNDYVKLRDQLIKNVKDFVNASFDKTIYASSSMQDQLNTLASINQTFQYQIVEKTGELDRARETLKGFSSEFIATRDLLSQRDLQLEETRSLLTQSAIDLSVTRNLLEQRSDELAQTRDLLVRSTDDLSVTRGLLSQRSLELDQTRASLAQSTGDLCVTRELLQQRSDELAQTRDLLVSSSDDLNITRDLFSKRSLELDQTRVLLADSTRDLCITRELLNQKSDELGQARDLLMGSADDLSITRKLLSQRSLELDQARDLLAQSTIDLSIAREVLGQRDLDLDRYDSIIRDLEFRLVNRGILASIGRYVVGKLKHANLIK
ncbi:polysaccharide pyruvyl transferase family protein [Methylobacterium sp. Leaf113]|uniref:polysaccharide pyruvyl transferase family protein n=1 Tax=Methylobacterium sp. Leaf113 TaxID=1736259 RepID=UPI0009EA575C|nr:polysaccharide pyruvyl transferase family protein [Methylobacterium sp. Leaf113]